MLGWQFGEVVLGSWAGGRSVTCVLGDGDGDELDSAADEFNVGLRVHIGLNREKLSVSCLLESDALFINPSSPRDGTLSTTPTAMISGVCSLVSSQTVTMKTLELSRVNLRQVRLDQQT